MLFYICSHSQKEEQTAILQANGVEHPEAFLAEAENMMPANFFTTHKIC